jgi:two-component system, NtrC family, response regulator
VDELADFSPGLPTAPASSILIVDDEESILVVLTRFLTQPGLSVDATRSGPTALGWARSKRYDILILDMKMPEMDGLTMLREIKRIDPSVSVIIMTAFGTVKSAVDAMKLGADEYLLKPLQLEALQILINKTLEYRRLREENRALRERLESGSPGGSIVARSKAMLDILHLVQKVGPLPSTVLVRGESGTGKELIARAIHAASPRAAHRFVALNCAVIPVNLLESELFGHEKGAFTGAEARRTGYFEAASGGTIFLDEISEMPAELQAKLLRVLQERRFQRLGSTDEIATDVRIIASTNRRLEDEIKAGRFRLDLYYRINVIAINVPPLRERREDISLLAFHFLHKYAKQFGKPADSISARAMELLLGWGWEGNVRELENVIERAVAVCDGAEITPADLPETFRGSPFPFEEQPLDQIVPFAEAKAEFERQYLLRLVRLADGNIARAARMASIPRPNLYEKLRKHGITKPGNP